jgi:hypothetical protein
MLINPLFCKLGRRKRDASLYTHVVASCVQPSDVGFHDACMRLWKGNEFIRPQSPSYWNSFRVITMKINCGKIGVACGLCIVESFDLCECQNAFSLMSSAILPCFWFVLAWSQILNVMNELQISKCQRKKGTSNFYTYKFWSFNCYYSSRRVLVDCDTVLSCMTILTFRRNILPPLGSKYGL